MDYSVPNNIDREFYQKDFSQLKLLVDDIRQALISGGKVDAQKYDLSDIIQFDNTKTFLYITLFQEGLSPIRWGSCRKDLNETINRDIEKIRSYKTFDRFALEDHEKCRILLQFI